MLGQEAGCSDSCSFRYRCDFSRLVGVGKFTELVFHYKAALNADTVTRLSVTHISPSTERAVQIPSVAKFTI